MTFSDLAPFAFVGVLLAGTVAYRRVMTAAQSHRLKLAEKGEAFLGRNDVPESLRETVSQILDDAFPNNVAFLLLAAALGPLLVPMATGDARARSEELSNTNRDVRGLFLEICSLHRRIALANHPLLYPLLELEVALIMVVMFVVRSVVVIGGEPSLDRDGVIMAMEQAQRHLRLAPARKVAA